MLRKSLALSIIPASFLSVGTLPSWADEHDDQAELAKRLSEANVTLDQGLKASEREGKPISGKYEIEDNGLQLSVYTMSGNKFTEVIIDHKSGTIKKAEPITNPEDLKAANEQRQAMAEAQRSLEQAVQSAIFSNGGYRAISIFPALVTQYGPVANVTLIKGNETKKLTERLN